LIKICEKNFLTKKCIVHLNNLNPDDIPQKEILQKCGKCVSGNVYYANVKTLLERVAPVMIDKEAIDSLVNFMDDAINGLNEISDEIPDVVEKGTKLLYVSI
jgi:hypothetical protein